MNRYIKSISLGAVLALALASVSAQTPAPAGTASAPATVGVTPQEAATATQQAVPRSDTGTLVQTSPSPADKARDALGDRTTPSAAPMTGTTGNGATATTRRARADRN
ncbi:MAG: hypothetical protein ABIR56_16830 [Polaromonas sp.]